MLSEPLLAVARLARAFDDLAIRYVVGGSLASSLYGILSPEHLGPSGWPDQEPVDGNSNQCFPILPSLRQK
jgi:hypothetical protein